MYSLLGLHYQLMLQSKPAGNEPDSPVVIVGAGLAGCHTAYELAKQGMKVVLLEASATIAPGASGNSAGIVKPFVTRDPGQTDLFYQCAFGYLLKLLTDEPTLKSAAQFNQCGVLQLLEKAYPDNTNYQACTPQQCTSIAGTRIDSSAIFFDQAGCLNPASLCRALVEHPNISVQLNSKLKQITRINTEWSIDLISNETDHDRLTCRTLILANGHGLNQFSQTKALPVTPARGQCSHLQLNDDGESNQLRTVVSGKRYALPTDNGVMIGASFARDVTDTQPSNNDYQDNLATIKILLPELAQLIAKPSVSEEGNLHNHDFCAIRATTPDRLPVVGPVPDFAFYSQAFALIKNGLPEHQFETARYQQGLFVIGGFGSRGIVSAPYCAKLLVQYLLDIKPENQPVPESPRLLLENWSALLHPCPIHH